MSDEEIIALLGSADRDAVAHVLSRSGVQRRQLHRAGLTYLARSLLDCLTWCMAVYGVLSVAVRVLR